MLNLRARDQYSLYILRKETTILHISLANAEEPIVIKT